MAILPRQRISGSWAATARFSTLTMHCIQNNLVKISLPSSSNSMAINPASHRRGQRSLSPSDDEYSQVEITGNHSSEESPTGETTARDETLGEPVDTPEAARQQISNVSFGALKQAHDTLSRKRKREQDNSVDQEAKLTLLRQRLQRIKQEKAGKDVESGRGRIFKAGRQSNSTPVAASNEYNEESSDEDASEDNTGATRSKHAPATQSSKRQVTRKRQVIDVPKRVTRDPRFDAVRQNASTTTGHEEKAYGFLRDYQKSEMQELKTAIKATRSEEDKEKLRRKLNSMESQVKTREAKERERSIVRKHRKEESEQAQQGKTPYFLKRGEIKQRVLVEKFQGMKGKDREKLLERRRRKESQKEKKRMPEFRRPTG